MWTKEECYLSSDGASQSIELVDVVLGDGASVPSHRVHHPSNLEELSAYFDSYGRNSFTCRLISLCQFNSWSSLQISRPVLDRISTEHGFGQGLQHLVSVFYQRTVDVEYGFCIPYTKHVRGPVTEISYTLRYPQYKPNLRGWYIRQSGVYHLLDSRTGQSVIVLFSPVANSAAQQAAMARIQQCIRSPDPMWIHEALFSAYFPAWREYIAHFERELLSIAGTTFSSYIDRPLRQGYDQLASLVSLENRFAHASSMLSHSEEVLGHLFASFGGDSNLVNAISSDKCGLLSEMRSHQSHCKASLRTAAYLEHRSAKTMQLLAHALGLRDQVVAQSQNDVMVKLSKSAMFLTMLTLLYLPASFVASFFGMNFFIMDQDGGGIAVSPKIWIYMICSVALTAVTLIAYYRLMTSEQKGREGRMTSVKQLFRRLMTNRVSGTVSTEDLTV
ncbi:hypothetical protein GQ53DRAFT_845153 [Thozetella sp. PMI_491]|nr:hypothetical protein GQ53DRAFT_845153 [Thozetella sp. PMI_491]